MEMRNTLKKYALKWQQDKKWSWSAIYETGERLLAWKESENIPGIFEKPPRMITATIDDGIGQGLKMIHLFSELAGIEVIRLGLMQTPEAIIAACVDQQPDFLGMTVLQFSSEEILQDINARIPEKTRIIAGGPALRIMAHNQTDKTD